MSKEVTNTTQGTCGCVLSCSCGKSAAQYVSKKASSIIDKEDVDFQLVSLGWKKNIRGEWRCSDCVRKHYEKDTVKQIV